jgi:hypothetical protein
MSKVSDRQLEVLRALILEVRDYYVSCGISLPNGPFELHPSMVYYFIDSCCGGNRQDVIGALQARRCLQAVAPSGITFSERFMQGQVSSGGRAG